VSDQQGQVSLLLSESREPYPSWSVDLAVPAFMAQRCTRMIACQFRKALARHFKTWDWFVAVVPVLITQIHSAAPVKMFVTCQLAVTTKILRSLGNSDDEPRLAISVFPLLSIALSNSMTTLLFGVSPLSPERESLDTAKPLLEVSPFQKRKFPDLLFFLKHRSDYGLQLELRRRSPPAPEGIWM